jgi:hypothetical protein
MKPPLPRIESAVPRTLHVQLEIAKAIRTLLAPAGDEQPEWLAENASAASQREQVVEIVRDALRIMRKAGFNPDEPRVPAGNPQGGQWTSSESPYAARQTSVLSDANPGDLWRPGSQYAVNAPPGPGHNQGPPLDKPPPIPPRPPARRSALNAFIKAAAYYLAAITKGAAGRYIQILQGVYWVATQALPYIRAYLSPPQTLKELQQDVLNPQVGYDVHHIVEQTPARKEGFSDDIIDGADNLVRIPTLKHWQINGWYGRPDEEFGGLAASASMR